MDGTRLAKFNNAKGACRKLLELPNQAAASVAEAMGSLASVAEGGEINGGQTTRPDRVRKRYIILGAVWMRYD